MEYPRRRDINAKTDSAYGQHQFAVDVVRFVEAVECPVHHPGSDQPECERVQQGRQNFETVIAKGTLYGGGPAGEVHGDQSQRDGCHVGQHTSRMGKEGQAAGQHAADDVGEHIADFQDKGDDQAALTRPAQVVPIQGVMISRPAVMVVFGAHGGGRHLERAGG